MFLVVVVFVEPDRQSTHRDFVFKLNGYPQVIAVKPKLHIWSGAGVLPHNG